MGIKHNQDSVNSYIIYQLIKGLNIILLDVYY